MRGTRESKLPVSLVIRTLILPGQGLTLMTSLDLNYFLIQIEPHWGLLELQHMNIGGTQTFSH